MHQASRKCAADVLHGAEEAEEPLDEEGQEEEGQEDVPATRPEQVAPHTKQSPAKQQADRLTSNQVQKNKGLQKQRESLKAGVVAWHNIGAVIKLYFVCCLYAVTYAGLAEVSQSTKLCVADVPV